METLVQSAARSRAWFNVMQGEERALETLVDPAAVLRAIANTTAENGPLKGRGLWMRTAIMLHHQAYLNFATDPKISLILDPCDRATVEAHGVLGVLIGLPVLLDTQGLLGVRPDEVRLLVQDTRHIHRSPNKEWESTADVFRFRWLQASDEPPAPVLPVCEVRLRGADEESERLATIRVYRVPVMGEFITLKEQDGSSTTYDVLKVEHISNREDGKHIRTIIWVSEA